MTMGGYLPEMASLSGVLGLVGQMVAAGVWLSVVAWAIGHAVWVVLDVVRQGV